MQNMAFLKGVHPSIKAVLGSINEPKTFKTWTIQKLMQAVAERAVAKLRDQTVTDEKPEFKRTATWRNPRYAKKIAYAQEEYPAHAWVAYAEGAEEEEED